MIVSLNKYPKLVWSIPDEPITPETITNLPPDFERIRIRLRQKSEGRAFLKFHDRIEEWILAWDEQEKLRLYLLRGKNVLGKSVWKERKSLVQRLMNWFKWLCLFAILYLPSSILAQSFVLTFPLSPSDTTLSATGTVSAYVASWSPTNGTGPTNWYIFGRIPAGQSNVTLNSTVPSPADIRVQSKNTNGVLSSNTNYIFYSTNALWASVSNNFVPPPPPGALTITN